MAQRSVDPALEAHLRWLAFVQPTGLVVSATALVQAGALLPRNDSAGQRELIESLEPLAPEVALAVRERSPGYGAGKDAEVKTPPSHRLGDFRTFARSVLGWSFHTDFFADRERAALPAELEVPLPEQGEVLRPDLAVREPDPKDGASPWQLLVRVLPYGVDLDKVTTTPGRLETSPQGAMERLLRQTGVPAGLLVNGATLRLVSAPRAESSGWIDFSVGDMVLPAGQPIALALRLLLNEQRLLAMGREKRLAALLEQSRRYQNTVSTQLSGQVLHALYELLRGLQAAHDASGRELLRRPLDQDPDRIYHALLTVVLRLVFLLYAEERALLPQGETFLRHYSLLGLFERLRADAAQHPDTMDQRYGAWSQLLVLFRLVHDGASWPGLGLPQRHGVLFDPDRFPFLEGRDLGARQVGERIVAPQIPDGPILRALEKLLVLDGERLSYRALDVEQIGSVYETMMGFRLELASGPSLAIRPEKAHGAPTPVDVDDLLRVGGSKRAAAIKDRTGRKKPEGKLAARIAAAKTREELHAALDPIVDRAATPDLVTQGAMVLRPSDARRKSGSHYTPRSLTEPIVRRTLAPILERLSANGLPPTPQQILDLKVCDPAMGSGAFLVEACRQLGTALVESWQAHGGTPPIPPDEDERILAMRIVAQRCLYGVDRNPMAVDLAKVSLWLATLAKDHALTFVDHALRHGDSLVGLSTDQIRAFHWETGKVETDSFAPAEALDATLKLRQQIQSAPEATPDDELRELWRAAEDQLTTVRLIGDLAVAAYFDADSPKARQSRRKELQTTVESGNAESQRGWIESLRHVERPLVPFHWPLEFPEVFTRPNPGFDAFVGNPPFAGKNTIGDGNIAHYLPWLQQTHTGAHGNSDIVAHFFRRAFGFLRQSGCFGLIATNTIAQGDTRATGLGWICTHGGDIFAAVRRYEWRGEAAVVVSIVHATRGTYQGQRLLDGRPVDTISAFLFHQGGHEDPKRLAANAGKSFIGSYVLGMGFTFDDTDPDGVATPVAEMHRLIAEGPANQEVIYPYIGGKEVNTSPTHAHHRYVIHFGDRDEAECRRRWPDLMAIVEAKVKPDRLLDKRPSYRRYWWQYAEKRSELQVAIAPLTRVLATLSSASANHAFAFLPTGQVFSHKLTILAFEQFAAFGLLQGTIHEVWSRFFGSTRGVADDLTYNPTAVFETFPFPEGWSSNRFLETAGAQYHDFRAALMVKNKEGLTETYNRFHDREEGGPDIAHLRTLHAALDRAVLDAYGWTDLQLEYDFILDYEAEDADTAEPAPSNKKGTRKKKDPYRYRFPDPLRDTLLARLLALNHTRALSESLAVPPAPAASRTRRGARPRRSDAPDLFA